jgi:hypothetical protein
MNDLEVDLQNSQNHILEWLTTYEKVSEDIIALNYNSKLHTILQAIADFDVDRIKEVENNIGD